MYNKSKRVEMWNQTIFYRKPTAKFSAEKTRFLKGKKEHEYKNFLYNTNDTIQIFGDQHKETKNEKLQINRNLP